MHFQFQKLFQVFHDRTNPVNYTDTFRLVRTKGYRMSCIGAVEPV